ncbi:MAG: hypothetical protein QXF05_05550 [Thermofilaceae archaeon]
MSALPLSEEERRIYERIERGGVEGVAKSEVVKGKRKEEILERLINRGLVVAERVGRGVRLWTRENYEKRRGAAPRVDITTIYEEVLRIREAVKDLAVIRDAVIALTQKVDELLALSRGRASRVTLEEFKRELDRAIGEVASPTGWAEMAEVRRVVCARLGISRDEFYERVTELIEASPGRYELSPGGGEGVVLGGKLYGLIRRR